MVKFSRMVRGCLSSKGINYLETSNHSFVFYLISIYNCFLSLFQILNVCYIKLIFCSP